MPQISPLASVHPDARLADDVVVDAFAIIESDVEIGAGSWIASHACILNGSRIGKKVRIFHGAVVAGIPQDLKFEGEDSLCLIGDGTSVREHATINRGTKAYGKTVLGKDCLIMAYAHIAHDCILGDHVILVNSVALAGHVEVGDWSILGGLSAVHQFVKIGEHVMVGGGSLVRKDVPPYITVAREPLNFEGVNVIGLRRREFSKQTIETIHQTYRLFYQSDLNGTQAMDHIESMVPECSYRENILNFIRNSERGVVNK